MGILTSCKLQPVCPTPHYTVPLQPPISSSSLPAVTFHSQVISQIRLQPPHAQRFTDMLRGHVTYINIYLACTQTKACIKIYTTLYIPADSHILSHSAILTHSVHSTQAGVQTVWHLISLCSASLITVPRVLHLPYSQIYRSTVLWHVQLFLFCQGTGACKKIA